MSGFWGRCPTAAPILWQYGALSRLNPARRSTSCSTAAIPTISLGYAIDIRIANI